VSLDQQSVSLDQQSVSLDQQSVSLDQQSVSLDQQSVSLYNTKEDTKEDTKEITKVISTIVETTTNENSFSFSYFDTEAEKRGFNYILKIATRFQEEKAIEKIQQFGEADFWAILQRIEDYIALNPKRARYKDLPRAFATFTGDADIFAAFTAVNAFWRTKYGTEYLLLADMQRGDKSALKSIYRRIESSMLAKKIDITDRQVVIEKIKAFFIKLPEHWANIKYFSLSTIAEAYVKIVADMKFAAPPAAAPRSKEDAAEAQLIALGFSADEVVLLKSNKVTNAQDVKTIRARAFNEKRLAPNCNAAFVAAMKVLRLEISII
jgi:hypothetical protein